MKYEKRIGRCYLYSVNTGAIVVNLDLKICVKFTSLENGIYYANRIKDNKLLHPWHEYGKVLTYSQT